MNATTTETDARAAFHDQFGYSDTPIEEYGSYSDDAERLSIGADDVVMWVPDDMSLPLGIPVAEFERTDDVTTAVGESPNDEKIPKDETDVLVFSLGHTNHTVRLTYVERLAEMEGVSLQAMCTRARIHNDFTHYPVVFPLETGRALVAPFIGDVNDE